MNWWVITGFIGQAAFFMRFLIQWIASEKKGESYFPIYFWYFSIAGGIILLAYAIHIADPVFTAGQACGLVVYLRNLMLIYKGRRKLVPAQAVAILPEEKRIMQTDIKRIAANCGSWLFKMRSYTPIPMILIMLFCFRWELENEILVWSCGPLLLVCGEGLRLWSLRYIGKFSRTRKKKARELVTAGPYAFIRNPLYLGNLFILVGFAVMSELVWLIPVIIILFFIQYQCIVLWEEDCLREFFPSAAEDYFRRVPRWLPNLPGFVNYPQYFPRPYYAWANVLRRERNTLQGIIMGCIAMMVKEFIS